MGERAGLFVSEIGVGLVAVAIYVLHIGAGMADRQVRQLNG